MPTSAICRNSSFSVFPAGSRSGRVEIDGARPRYQDGRGHWRPELDTESRHRAPGLHPATQDIGDGWLEGAESAVLQVPSAVVFGETSFIVNPEHPDFHEIHAGPVADFRYDSRLATPGR